MSGITDRLGDLSWLGDAYADQGWVQVGEAASTPITADEANATIAQLLQSSAWAVASDDPTITRGQRADWIAFRQALRNIPLQPDFPTNIVWPNQPE